MNQTIILSTKEKIITKGFANVLNNIEALTSKVFIFKQIKIYNAY